jgi:hypothetical protein
MNRQEQEATEVLLIEDLEFFCEANELPWISADELLSDLTGKSSELTCQMAWLDSFIKRWDENSNAAV